MGYLSSAWKSVKKGVSTGYDSIKDGVRDVTGVDSINTLLATGGLATVPALLAGKGIVGETITDALGPILGAPIPPGIMGPGGLQGPSLPAGLNFGTGVGSGNSAQGGNSAQAPSSSNLASLFGNTGYSFGPQSTSAALLQSNPGAYNYAPLMSSLS
jgi:hypothetical protein